MTMELWLGTHSYLRPLADLTAQVDRAMAEIEVLEGRMPDWEDYLADFLAGVPLFHSTDIAIDLEPAGRMVGALLGRLASETSSGTLEAEARALDTKLRNEPQASHRIADFLLGDETLRASFPGLLRYLAWTATALPPPNGQRLQSLARRGAVASQILPYVRILACDVPTGRRRPRAHASALVRLLRNALAIPANWVPLLRNRGWPSALGTGDRRRETPANRLLSILQGLPQNL